MVNKEESKAGFIERLGKALDQSGKSKASIANYFDVSAQAVGKWFKKGTVSKDRLSDLSDFLGVDYLWLATGKKASDTQEIQSFYSEMEASTDSIFVDHLSAESAMGNGIDDTLDHDRVINTIEPTKLWIDHNLPSLSNHKNLKIITGRGRSMTGMYNDGDLLWCDTGVRTIEYDAVYALRLNGQLYIKNVLRSPTGQEYELISENPTYGRTIVTENDEFEVLGLILGVMNFVKL